MHRTLVCFLTVLLLCRLATASEWTHRRVVCANFDQKTDWTDSLIAVDQDSKKVHFGSTKAKLIASSLNGKLLAVDLGRGDIRIVSKLKQATDEDIESLISSVTELKYQIMTSPSSCSYSHRQSVKDNKQQAQVKAAADLDLSRIYPSPAKPKSKSAFSNQEIQSIFDKKCPKTLTDTLTKNTCNSKSLTKTNVSDVLVTYTQNILTRVKCHPIKLEKKPYEFEASKTEIETPSVPEPPSNNNSTNPDQPTPIDTPSVPEPPNGNQTEPEQPLTPSVEQPSNASNSTAPELPSTPSVPDIPDKVPEETKSQLEEPSIPPTPSIPEKPE